MITKLKTALGITNRELIKSGIHKTQISRSKKDGFPKYYEILLTLLITEVNMLKKNEFIREMVKLGTKHDTELDLRNQILGITRYMIIKKESIPEWMDVSIAEEIIKKRK